MGVQPEVYIGNSSIVLVMVVKQRDGRSFEFEVSQHGKGWFEILWMFVMFVCFHMCSMFSQKHPVQEPRITPASAASALCPKAEEIVLYNLRNSNVHSRATDGLQDVIVSSIEEDEPEAEWFMVVQKKSEFPLFRGLLSTFIRSFRLFLSFRFWGVRNEAWRVESHILGKCYQAREPFWPGW